MKQLGFIGCGEIARSTARAVSVEGTCSVTAEDGLRLVEVVPAAYQSAGTGRPVETRN